ncbi:hypothetical protein LEP1GSC202_0355 [Leptospira yanagawae serovar Saopaulo str. Sao Paulo = ATCC 700523]|uniref:PF14280 domain protein n=1 Tax=Leptospira yanagawae serovar Saopaulo str. Sao Paulo = ATCC 700523 TaxID=1249483 RepID=A0A5E8HGI0_9LEPT|nr:hypothetical protein [Leptospira yanagawae]EOQ90375.1 hypothetical protein LEP1GSC202_0355 [Leptospira yanagawae serovar Saopaulo str. Sao Paulo = ATCC 700523]
MSGVRNHNFREGDRSEYLANYLLSGLGLVTPVPRPEDIGIDFFCNISDQENGLLSFGYPYVIQIKSSSTKDILIGSNEIDKWKKEGIDWLFKQELPLFIGIVDKKNIKIDIYNTSTLSFIHRFSSNCSQILLKPRFDYENNEEVKQPTKTKLNNWPSDHFGDGYCHEVDLGKPIISLTHSDFDLKDKLIEMKNTFRLAIFIEQKNIVYRNLKLPYFNWILLNEINKKITPAWIYSAIKKENTDGIIQNLVPSIISLALIFFENNEFEKLELLKPSIKLLPRPMIFENLIVKYPKIFDDLL